MQLSDQAPSQPPTLDDAVRRALRHGQVVDITTTGRRSGQPRRIEIVTHSFDGHLYISGMPSRRTRAWIHNLESDPRMTLHLKGAVRADLAAVARIITDATERRSVLARVARAWKRTDVDAMVTYSPLIEVSVVGDPDGATG